MRVRAIEQNKTNISRKRNLQTTGLKNYLHSKQDQQYNLVDAKVEDESPSKNRG